MAAKVLTHHNVAVKKPTKKKQFPPESALPPGVKLGELTPAQLTTLGPEVLASSLLVTLGLYASPEASQFWHAGGHLTVDQMGADLWAAQCWGGEGSDVICAMGLGGAAAEALLLGELEAAGGLMGWAKATMLDTLKEATALLKAPYAPPASGPSVTLSSTHNTVSMGVDDSAAQAILKAAGFKPAPAKSAPPVDLAQVSQSFADKSCKAQSGPGAEDDFMGFPEMTDAEMKTVSTVKLVDATKLYQPVQGTSSGSRYFAVGIAPSLKVGVRYGPSSIAIRIEGPMLADAETRMELKTFGFSNATSDYGSMHLNVGDIVLARKLLGSVLMGLGVEWPHPLVDLKRLHQKGA